MRDIYMQTYDEDVNELKRGALIDLGVIAIMLIAGSLIMMAIESWTSDASFYWACCTISTVGYGDIVPTTDMGKVFTIFYALFGCGYMAKSVSNLVKFPLVLRARASEVELLDQFGVKDGTTGYLSANKMKAIFENELHEQYPSLTRVKGEMSKSEFVLLVIYMMNKVDDKDILLVGKLFDRLDAGSVGYLTKDHMSQQVRAAQTRDIVNQGPTVVDERGSSFSEVVTRTLSSVLASGSAGIASQNQNEDNEDSNNRLSLGLQRGSKSFGIIESMEGSDGNKPLNTPLISP